MIELGERERAAPSLPLPTEIAGLINSARAHAGDCEGMRQAVFLECAAALEQMAREIKRLEEVQKSCHRDIVRQAERILELEQAIIEGYEADVKRETADKLVANLRIVELEAERDKAVAMADELWLARESIRTESDRWEAEALMAVARAAHLCVADCNGRYPQIGPLISSFESLVAALAALRAAGIKIGETK